MKKSTKRNVLGRGAAIVMAILLAVPALPVGAADAGVADPATEKGEVTSGEQGNSDAEGFGDGGTESPDTEVYGNDRTEGSVSDNNAALTVMEPAEARAAASTGTIGTPDGAGHVLEWSYDDSTQTLTITGSGVITGSNALLAAPLDNMEIREIKFQDCKVTGSMEQAFYKRDDLEEIDLSGLDTSGVTNMRGMFEGCSSLSSLDVSNFDTGNVTDMRAMFGGCNSLSTLDVSNFETTNVTDMRRMFSGCNGLSNLDVSNFETGSVTDMEGMFQDCSGLSSLNVSNFDTGNVTDMKFMFYYCSSLSSLDVSNFETRNVTDMKSMFSNCHGLSSLDVNNFETGHVTDMESMFSYCSNLDSLDVSNFETGNVADMRYMFHNCNNLDSLDVSNFDTGNVTDMEAMFLNCSGLRSLDVSGFETGNVTDMSVMFYGCQGLSSLNVSNFETGNVTAMDGMFYGCKSLSNLDLGNFDTGNVTDMRCMFYGCSGLSSLDVSNFETGNVTNMSWMFHDCSGLSSVDLGNFDAGNVTDMKCMFQGCSGLKSLDLSSFDTSGVTNMLGMFNGCSSLSSLDVSNFDTGNVTDMEFIFHGCSGLKSLDLSSFDTSNVTSMSDIFYECTGLSTLQTPRNVGLSVTLPTVSTAVWHLPDGTEVTELPQNLSASVLLTRTPVITTTTEELNMPDVIRVKYVPYSYTVETDNADPDNQVTFSVVEGRLAEGLQMYPATGEIYGVPLEAGEFKVTVQASYSNPKYPASYAELTLIVLENTDANVDTATDSGYEITQPVPDLDTGSLSGDGSQLLVSEGEYAEFQDAVYLDGRRLQSGTEYTSEAGSTRITIRNQTLADAGAGSHTLSLEFRTQDTGALRRAAQNLVISGTGNDSSVGGGTEDDSDDSEEDADNSGQNTLAASGAAAVIDYIVQPGDNLWRIAARFYGNGMYWRQIYTDNVGVIRHPDRLRAGQHIKICLTSGNGMAGTAVMAFNASMPATGNSYVVQPGDNLWGIAGKVYGKSTRWREIYEANRNILSDPKRIYPKQVLFIP